MASHNEIQPLNPRRIRVPRGVKKPTIMLLDVLGVEYGTKPIAIEIWHPAWDGMGTKKGPNSWYYDPDESIPSEEGGKDRLKKSKRP